MMAHSRKLCALATGKTGGAGPWTKAQGCRKGRKTQDIVVPRGLVHRKRCR